MITEEKPRTYTRELLIEELYKTVFPQVAIFVRRMKGTPDEAKDIFQDALVIYYEKHRVGNFTPEQGHEPYLMGIAKHLWYKKHRHDNRFVETDGELYDVEEIHEPKVSARLLRFVEMSGKKCLDLLSAFYYEKLNMKELAERFGFSGERSATVQKHKCLEKVRESISERTLSKEDFYE